MVVSAVAGFILIILLITCICLLCQRRNCRSYNTGRSIEMRAIGRNNGTTRSTISCFSNERDVLYWLRTVILALDNQVEGNESLRGQLHLLLQQMQLDGVPLRRVELEGDLPEEGGRNVRLDGDGADEQAMIQEMIDHLKQILMN